MPVMNATPQNPLDNVSIITCPECGGTTAETMPENACVYFYRCRHCGAMLRPLAGDCCVFCSYGDRPCPPKTCAVDESP